MPFVPLSKRKPIVPVILDDEKVQMQAEQKAIDEHTVALHKAHMPSAAGYRFGRHPATHGPVRGPEMPFKGATSPWQPPEADDANAASKRARDHCGTGAYWEASHSLRTMRSAPSLYNTGAEMAGKKSVLDVTELTHPLSTEIKRWQKFGEFSEGEIRSDIKFADHRRPPAKPIVPTPGLVNFPKYLLINDCNLKTVNQIAFVESEAVKRKAAEDAAEARAKLAAESGIEVADAQSSTGFGAPQSPVKYGQPSWGAPKLRNAPADTRPHCWAGNGLPGGRGSRTSNPFRIG